MVGWAIIGAIVLLIVFFCAHPHRGQKNIETKTYVVEIFTDDIPDLPRDQEIWPVKIEKQAPPSNDLVPTEKTFFDPSNMPYWQQPDSGWENMYSPEGLDRTLATRHLLSLNRFIAEASYHLKISLPTIHPDLIVWRPYRPKYWDFTWLSVASLTPTGKTPKYEHSLRFMAATSPTVHLDLFGGLIDSIGGEIYYIKKRIGKVEIRIFNGGCSFMLYIKLVNDEPRLWKIIHDAEPGSWKTLKIV